ncbi:MAG TPA: molybdopterin-synthase adenylyltransferase MoeB [Vicinamibacterales bacterium]|nr:molybdopterin-synthase adenylyltransferase MoeB [Vicinamibacterales bacterium]
MELSRDELVRFSRHLTLAELGVEGQERLKAGRVLCVGAGGLGSPAALYLAAAGVGTIGLVDDDVVDVTNLQRQVLYTTVDIGRPKLQAAAERLRAMNPHLSVETHDVMLDASNALALVSAYDVILDGTDNFTARYLVNDACVMAGRPNAYGSIFRFEGQASVFAARNGPCYRCLHPEPPPPGLVPNCAEAGVLGVLPGIIGTIQATEAIKLIAGIGEPLIGRFVIYDALRMRFRELKLRKDPECPVCGEHPTIRELTAYEGYCDAGRLRPASTAVAVASRPGNSMDITVKELKERMDRGDAPRVIDVREPHEHAICNIPGAELIPAAQFVQRLGEFDKDSEIVVHCKSGGRSGRAVEMMKARGFRNARNLTGGVQAWINEIDPTQPKY